MQILNGSTAIITSGNGWRNAAELHDMEFSTGISGRRPAQETRNQGLSPREKQIVSLVSEAKLNKEIAYELNLTEGTVKVYLTKIYMKVDVKNRTELALWAVRHPERTS
jgi:DNA-binding NarL/FixJ family response regulator